MDARPRRRGQGIPVRAFVGVACVLVGEALVIARHRPLSDFYFPFAWLGFILVLDAGIAAQLGRSLWSSRRVAFLAMFPVSAVFWWIFEWFNLAVHNWVYVGAGSYTGVSYVAFASLDFSFVLLAVWSASLAIYSLLPYKSPGPAQPGEGVPGWAALSIFVAGLLSLVLPVLWPRYAFPLIWCSLFFLLDPINLRLGRPSMLREVAAQNWRVPVACALGGLLCGLFWEGWNEWATPRWAYDIPYVGFWHVFQMPLLGWLGYLPFGLELYAMTNFVLPFLGLGTFTPEGLSHRLDTDTAARPKDAA